MPLKTKKSKPGRSCVNHQCHTIAQEQRARAVAMNATVIDPLEDRVVVTILVEDREKVSRGGIYLPEITQDNNQTAIARVVSVGPGRVLPDGSHKPISLQPGDNVLVSQYAGVTVELPERGEQLRVLRESDILAVIR